MQAPMQSLAVMGAGVDLTANLQHYWHPSVSGDSNDLVGSLHGTPTNLASLDANGWGFGTSGDRYVTLSGPITNGTAYSVTMWIYPNVTQMNAHIYGGFALSDRETSGNRDFQVWYSKEAAGVQGSIFSTDGIIEPSGAISPMMWSHVVVTVGNGNVKLYVNAVLIATANLTGVPYDVSSIPARFGNSSWAPISANLQWHGNIDHCRIYAEVLAPKKITALLALGR